MIREIEIDDYHKGYFELLAQLTEAPEMTFLQFQKTYYQTKTQGKIVLVIEDESSNKIVATASIMIEHKFIHGGQKVGHIEDVVVNTKHRNKGYAKQLIDKLVSIGNDNDCYKVILNCSLEMTKFYSKLEFEVKGTQMVRYKKYS